MRFLLLLTFLFALSSPSLAMERAKVGDVIPHDLRLMDQNAVEQSFDLLAGEKGATLVFFRSVDWCPYCQLQLTNLSSEAKKIHDLGYPLIAISYDSIDDIQAFDKKLQMKSADKKSGLVFLSDPKSEAIKAFGLFNTNNREGSFAYGVPHPAIYVVNKDKTIKAVLAEDGYKDRPEIDAIIDAIVK